MRPAELQRVVLACRHEVLSWSGSQRRECRDSMRMQRKEAEKCKPCSFGLTTLQAPVPVGLCQQGLLYVSQDPQDCTVPGDNRRGTALGTQDEQRHLSSSGEAQYSATGYRGCDPVTYRSDSTAGSKDLSFKHSARLQEGLSEATLPPPHAGLVPWKADGLLLHFWIFPEYCVRDTRFLLRPHLCLEEVSSPGWVVRRDR